MRPRRALERAQISARLVDEKRIVGRLRELVEKAAQIVGSARQIAELTLGGGGVDQQLRARIERVGGAEHDQRALRSPFSNSELPCASSRRACAFSDVSSSARAGDTATERGQQHQSGERTHEGSL